MKRTLVLLLWAISFTAAAQSEALKNKISQSADKIEGQVIAWRRDFHEHPELGNNEVRTADIVAKHLRSLGIEVKDEKHADEKFYDELLNKSEVDINESPIIQLVNQILLTAVKTDASDIHIDPTVLEHFQQFQYGDQVLL